MMDIKGKAAPVTGGTSVSARAKLAGQGARWSCSADAGTWPARSHAGPMVPVAWSATPPTPPRRMMRHRDRAGALRGAPYHCQHRRGMITDLPIVQHGGTPTPLKEFRRLADTDPTGTFSVMSHAVSDPAQ